MDTLPNLVWCTHYRVCIDINGKIIPSNTIETVKEVSKLSNKDLKGISGIEWDYSNSSKLAKEFIGCSYESQEHALKLATECKDVYDRSI